MMLVSYNIYLQDRETKKIMCLTTTALTDDTVEEAHNLALALTDADYTVKRVKMNRIIYFEV